MWWRQKKGKKMEEEGERGREGKREEEREKGKEGERKREEERRENDLLRLQRTPLVTVLFQQDHTL